MSPTPESDLSAPKDPAAYRPRRLLGAGFWGVLVFGFLCVLAGAAIWALAPRLVAQKPAPRLLNPFPPSEPARPVPPPAAQAAPPATPASPATSDAGEIQRLEGRVAALEAGQARTVHAAAVTLAAAAAVEASQGSRPFSEEVSVLRGLSSPSPELTELSRLAQTGAPSRAELAAAFPDYASRAAAAARKPGEGAPLGDRIAYALSRIVMVRRVGDVAGDGPDAGLARAERFVQDGDFQSAFAALDRLPPAAREAMSPWRMRAERRAAIDRYAADLRARALAELAGGSGDGA
jgi:hypothetical protein